jgi:hypothetical protein
MIWRTFFAPYAGRMNETFSKNRVTNSKTPIPVACILY